jgi:hypothetical protein
VVAHYSGETSLSPSAAVTLTDCEMIKGGDDIEGHIKKKKKKIKKEEKKRRKKEKKKQREVRESEWSTKPLRDYIDEKSRQVNTTLHNIMRV